MSINLLSMATQALGGDFAQRVGQLMGETEGSAQSALGGMLPAILGTVAQKGGSADGAAGILAMLTGPHVNGSWLDNIGAIMTPGSAQAGPVAQAGTAILGTLFGDKLGGLVSTVASMSGLKSGNVSGLLQMVAPLVMSVLAKHVSSNKLDAGGLHGLLHGQQSSLAAAIDPRLGGVLGLGGLISSVMGSGAGKVTGAVAAASGALGGAASGAFGSATGALGAAGSAISGAAGTASSTLGTAAGAASAALGGGIGKAAGAAGTATTAAAGAAVGMAKAGSGGLMRWLPWLIGAVILLWLFKSCMGPAQKVAEAPAAAPAPAAIPATPPASPRPVEAAKPAEPAKAAEAPTAKPAAPSSAALASMPPLVKVYFASGQSSPSAEALGTLKPIVDYAKADPAAKLRLSGFHDKTGSPAANQELAKNRAKGIAAQLVAAGIAESRLVFDSPAETVGGGSDREARRVEVSIAK